MLDAHRRDSLGVIARKILNHSPHIELCLLYSRKLTSHASNQLATRIDQS